jgi:DtxR family Mn-dependent transcriptional regulator
VSHHSDLIDTTEMYLKTVYELEEEGIVPLRARIAERLHQSGPTVSQTVARMERDGLLAVEGDRHLELSAMGRSYAIRVMRKHRLAERLLTDMIGLDWALVHVEACRWEHVISEDVERRLVQVLDHPIEDPYGNPIPGLDELGEHLKPAKQDEAEPIDKVLADAGGDHVKVTLRRIAEPLQTSPDQLEVLEQAGVFPGSQVQLSQVGDRVRFAPLDDSGQPGSAAELAESDAVHIFVKRL